MNNPQISVLVPVYKVEPYLQRCINSVLSQDFTDWELILVDDGSPDRCPEICDKNAAEHPGKIKVIHKENGGLITARKAGVQIAQGKYYVFVDSDDTLRSGALSILYNQVVKGYDMVRGGAFRKTNKGEKFPLETYTFEEGKLTCSAEFIQKLYIGDVAPYLWGAIYKASLFNDNVYNETIKQGINVGEDWVTNMIIARNIHQALYIKDKVYDYYVNSESYMSTHVMSYEYCNRIDAVLTKHDILNNDILNTYVPIKKSIVLLNSFFIPELPFSVGKYKYVKKIMNSHIEREIIIKKVDPKHLYFFKNYILYRTYTHIYKFLFKHIKLRGHLRKVIY